MTDQKIIEHLRNNKYSMALKGLYDLLPAVNRYIKTNSGSADDARDIFQDALVVLYKKVQSGDLILTVPLKVYLLAIAKNCWLQELRLRKKIPTVVVAYDVAETSVDDEPGFIAATAAFNLLGEKCKQLLILFYFKKQSFRQIAAVLSFSNEKIAKNQKYRCLQKAKENYISISNNGTHE